MSECTGPGDLLAARALSHRQVRRVPAGRRAQDRRGRRDLHARQARLQGLPQGPRGDARTRSTPTAGSTRATSATIDADGFLQITDRKKDLLITAGGENIAPQVIEGHLKGIPVVAQAVVIGDRRKYLAALVTLDPERVEDRGGARRAARAQTSTTPRSATCSASTSRSRSSTVNEKLARVQTIKKFTIIADGVHDRRRRADAHHEGEAQGREREVQGRDRGPLPLRGGRRRLRPGLTRPGRSCGWRSETHGRDRFADRSRRLSVGLAVTTPYRNETRRPP